MSYISEDVLIRLFFQLEPPFLPIQSQLTTSHPEPITRICQSLKALSYSCEVATTMIHPTSTPSPPPPQISVLRHQHYHQRVLPSHEVPISTCHHHYQCLGSGGLRLQVGGAFLSTRLLPTMNGISCWGLHATKFLFYLQFLLSL